MKAIIDIPPAKGLFAEEGDSHGLLYASLGAISVADVELVGMELLLSFYPNRPEFVTSARLGATPSGDVVGAHQGNPK